MKLQLFKVKKVKTCKRIGNRFMPIVDSAGVAVLVHVEKRDLWLDLTRVSNEIKRKARDNPIILIPFAHISSSLASMEDAKKIIYELSVILRDSGCEIISDEFGIPKSIDISVNLGDPINFMEFRPRSIVPAYVFYEKLGKRFSKHLEENGHYDAQERMLELLREHLTEPILDTGCGQGRLISAILRLGHSRVMGNDLAKGIQHELQGFVSTQEDAHILQSYEEGSLGTIICCNLAYYLDFERALFRWNQLLVQGGKLIIIEEWPFIYPKDSDIGGEFSRMLRKIVRPVKPEKLSRLVVNSGLQLVERKMIDIDENHELQGFVFQKQI
ncbi:MAG: threonyl-tRNA synthetase editing domain-containing protein [Candidatus ainarchaeum sp.]|nr:threonyl-tRNA synthetase editing domain-containing protein [Candidatus ainarchaeum sp.]